MAKKVFNKRIGRVRRKIEIRTLDEVTKNNIKDKIKRQAKNL